MIELSDRTRAFVSGVIESPVAHARWLNTLSFLEYIGSRKIVKSQQAEQLSFYILEHLAEEARHALMLKKMCLTLSPDICPTFAEKDLLAGAAPERYFQNLDRGTQAFLVENAPKERVEFLNYLYVTWLIELRALEVYSIYQRILGQHTVALSLKSLIGEENRHLQFTEKYLQELDLNFSSNSQRLKQMERDEFAWLLTEMEKSLV